MAEHESADSSPAAGGPTQSTTVTPFGEDDFSIFPPSLHENLTPSQTLTLYLEKAVEEEEEEGCVGHVRWRRWFSQSALRAVELVRSKTRGGGGGAVWSFAAMAGLVGALVYMRWRHRREKRILLLLLLDKDKQIAQLVKQVAHMNEVISSRPRISIPKIT